MAIKALATDDNDSVHLIIGLNRENIDSLLRGDYFYLPSGAMPLNENSQIVIVFAETDRELEKRCRQSHRSHKGSGGVFTGQDGATPGLDSQNCLDTMNSQVGSRSKSCYETGHPRNQGAKVSPGENS